MKTVVIISMILVLCSCAAPNAGGSATTASPSPAASANVDNYLDALTLFRQFVEAENRGNVEGALQLLANDVVWERGGQCPQAACIGKDAVRREITRDVGAHHDLTIVSAEGTGETAKVRIELRSDGTRRGNVERIIQIFSLTRRADKLSAVRVEQDASDPQTAALLAKQDRSSE